MGRRLFKSSVAASLACSALIVALTLLGVGGAGCKTDDTTATPRDGGGDTAGTHANAGHDAATAGHTAADSGSLLDAGKQQDAALREDSGPGNADDSGTDLDAASQDSGAGHNGSDSGADSGGGAGSNADSGPLDTDSGTDAATPSDASVGIDAAVGTDAATPGDAAVGTDAATATDAAVGGDASTCTTLTVKNTLSWCSLTVNGGTASAAATQTVCVPQGTISLQAVQLGGFKLGPWHHTDGDVGAGQAAANVTVTVGATAKCVWICCPFTNGTGCPTSDQCP